MKNKEVKENFIKIANLIKEAGELYSICFFKSEETMEENIRKIIELETQGDEIQTILDNHYKNEKNIPFLAIDRVKLLQTLDKTLDDASLAARTLSAFYSELPEEFEKSVSKLAENVKIITQKLAIAVETIYDDFKAAHELTKEIEDLRDASLEESFRIENKFFISADVTNGWKGFTSVSTITKKTMAVIKSVRNAAEIITIMSIKYL